MLARIAVGASREPLAGVDGLARRRVSPSRRAHRDRHAGGRRHRDHRRDRQRRRAAGVRGDSGSDADRPVGVAHRPRGPRRRTPCKARCCCTTRWADPIAVALAELLAGQGYDTGLVTPDRIAGKHLAQTGDLVAANARLQRAGVLRHLASRIRSVDADGAVLEDVHTGKRRRVPCATVVDCGHRLPEPANVAGIRVGDCVAPRTVLEAVREARAAALAVAET